MYEMSRPSAEEGDIQVGFGRSWIWLEVVHVVGGIEELDIE